MSQAAAPQSRPPCRGASPGRFRYGALPGAAFASASILLVLVGCTAVPMASLDDPQSLEITIHRLASTRVFQVGVQPRFKISVTNRTDASVLVDNLAVTLEAESSARPVTRLFSARWTYPDLRTVLPPQKDLTFFVVPEPHEFNLAIQRPGFYGVRANVLDRFYSKPIEVRVDPPPGQRR